MSVFGGDSWAPEAHHRKRRLDDLLLSNAPSSSYKKLSNGKYACLVCPHNPVLDTPLMISMHNRGSRHITAETRMKQEKLSRQQELNKRIALSSACPGVLNSGTSTQQPKRLGGHKKPLIEHTRKAILETQSQQPDKRNAVRGYNNTEPNNANSRLYDSKFSAASNHRFEPSQNIRNVEGNNTDNISTAAMEVSAKALADWHAEQQKRREKELKFTAAGWRRDCHGKWYKDENVEFDSDEEDPNDSLNRLFAYHT